MPTARVHAKQPRRDEQHARRKCSRHERKHEARVDRASAVATAPAPSAAQSFSCHCLSPVMVSTGDPRYESTERVLNGPHGLNEAIANAAATVPGTLLVPVNFDGHDVCAQGQEWVFAPHAFVGLEAFGLSYTQTLLGQEICPDPVSKSEKSLDLHIPIFKSGTPIVVGYVHLGGSLNCLPHPTAPGQQVIANSFEGAYLGAAPAARRAAAIRHRLRSARQRVRHRAA